MATLSHGDVRGNRLQQVDPKDVTDYRQTQLSLTDRMAHRPRGIPGVVPGALWTRKLSPDYRPTHLSLKRRRPQGGASSPGQCVPASSGKVLDICVGHPEPGQSMALDKARFWMQQAALKPTALSDQDSGFSVSTISCCPIHDMMIHDAEHRIFNNSCRFVTRKRDVCNIDISWSEDGRDISVTIAEEPGCRYALCCCLPVTVTSSRGDNGISARSIYLRRTEFSSQAGRVEGPSLVNVQVRSIIRSKDFSPDTDTCTEPSNIVVRPCPANFGGNGSSDADGVARIPPGLRDWRFGFTYSTRQGASVLTRIIGL
ncbi:hypothetical protein Bbelb_104830 [Branchiostoma belcheri]|nr:hypothetical protein Bbelb_104830 [Branchiostoma belcheri]